MATRYRKALSRSRSRRLGRYTRRTPISRVVRRVAYGIPEKKYTAFGPFNFQSGADDLVPLTSTAQFYMFSLLNGITVGTDVSNRIGRQIYVRHIQICMTFSGDGDALTNGAACRYAVVHDRAAIGGGLPASGEIWQGGADAASVANVTSFRNSDHMRRYSVKYDRMHNVAQLSQGTAGTTYTPRGIAMFTIPINKKINYDTSSSVVNTNVNLIKDDYYVCVAASTPNCCIARVYWRVCFNDS